ncbi:hypothetical protein [Roseateles oligotrophus]|uniref:Uncharacterized protein n=1 Tax=Roseateles oligotrophus TaxID=1769250 RepID=A0ABT2YBA3_9BURK|nr:hypothetical protein [Roseateles oligotrophus]MCV2367324.1 hypothetical protein [Roseateles oligotrophus]
MSSSPEFKAAMAHYKIVVVKHGAESAQAQAAFAEIVRHAPAEYIDEAYAVARAHFNGDRPGNHRRGEAQVMSLFKRR